MAGFLQKRCTEKMNSERQFKNIESVKAKAIQYPHLVATQRNDNYPRPEGVERNSKGHMCRVPLEDYILWMFEHAEDADNFRHGWKTILVRIKPYEEN